MTREYERVRCPACKRVIAAYVPHRGDGSDVRMVKHREPKPSIKLCFGGDRLVGELRSALKEKWGGR